MTLALSHPTDSVHLRLLFTTIFRRPSSSAGHGEVRFISVSLCLIDSHY